MATCNVAAGTRCKNLQDASACTDFWCGWRRQFEAERAYDAVVEYGRTLTPEQRQAGFVASMRAVDTPTLRRWSRNTKLTQNRREVAVAVLRERGIFDESTLCPVCGAAWDAFGDKCPNPNCR